MKPGDQMNYIMLIITLTCGLICVLMCCCYCKEDQSIVDAPRDHRADTEYVKELREKCKQISINTDSSSTQHRDQDERESQGTQL